MTNPTRSGPATGSAGNRGAAREPVPRPALVLAIAGLVPFIAAPVAALFPEAGFDVFVRLALAPYGVIVLSFMGGVHWGLAMVRSDRDAALPAAIQYVVGFAAPLYAFGALILAPGRLIGVLIVGFVLLTAFDVVAARLGAAPSWFPRLRLPATLVIIVCLALNTGP